MKTITRVITFLILAVVLSASTPSDTLSIDPVKKKEIVIKNELANINININISKKKEFNVQYNEKINHKYQLYATDAAMVLFKINCN